ncbi:hypothetical protein [Afifella sp. IM 167]|uniref:hypothetical protein n=1 Tax=Afifella sp. IM 167 TaxID=2033586 RepID=UPI001CCF904F|nr:hypothetical protein [Afifella sp. IM 167]MBZ8133147.1 hypothetical protein [Afifella sp. IM 167]
MRKYIIAGLAAATLLLAAAAPTYAEEKAAPTGVVENALKLAQAQDAAACNGIPTGELGRCTLDNPPEVLNNLNCVACCAHRNALTWISANHNVACQ